MRGLGRAMKGRRTFIPKSRWWWQLPNGYTAFGPTELRFATEREARHFLRRLFKSKGGILPKGMKLWRADPKEYP